MKKMQLEELAGIGSTTLAKLSKDGPGSMDVMARVCRVLEGEFFEPEGSQSKAKDK